MMTTASPVIIHIPTMIRKTLFNGWVLRNATGSAPVAVTTR